MKLKKRKKKKMPPTFKPDNNRILVKLLSDSEKQSLYKNIQTADSRVALARVQSVDEYDDYGADAIVLVEVFRATKLNIDGSDLLLVDVDTILGRVEE